MWKTKGKLLETVDKLLDENKRLRQDKEIYDDFLAKAGEERDKLRAENEKLKSDAGKRDDELLSLRKRLEEMSKQLRDQAAADILLHALKGIKKVLGGTMEKAEHQDVYAKQEAELQKRYDKACADGAGSAGVSLRRRLAPERWSLAKNKFDGFNSFQFGR